MIGGRIQEIFLSYNETSISYGFTTLELSEEAMQARSADFFSQLLDYVNFVTCGQFNEDQKQAYLKESNK